MFQGRPMVGCGKDLLIFDSFLEGVQDLQIYVGRERNYGSHMVATDMVLYP